MGGQEFETNVVADNAKEAFISAQRDARYDHGHSGYTGTIAEKTEFKYLPPPRTISINDVHAFMGGTRPKDPELAIWASKACKVYDDKWGPALCLAVIEDEVIGKSDPRLDLGPDNEYLFIGVASS